jgi:hypothetical protein
MEAGILSRVVLHERHEYRFSSIAVSYGNKVWIKGIVGIDMIVGILTVVGGGGRVAGGSEVFVAGTEVGGTEVRVGMKRVGILVSVGPASRVRTVAVGRKVPVGVGVRVAEGVAVGIVDVMVGMSEGVCVGTVEVGNGPSRASEVSARAVLVRAAFPKAPGSMSAPRNANHIQRTAARKKASSPRVRRLDRLPVTFKLWFPYSLEARDRWSVGWASGWEVLV